MTDKTARIETLFREAERLLPDYLARTADLTHANKGIRRSEMFFFYALTAPLPPAKIVESGRARAQSTLVLSRLFPETAIVSLESDANSPDVQIAAERLRDCPNVECRFGDSLQLLPPLVQRGDVVLIDGPKDFRALRLAFHLLEERDAAAVFVHDLWLGSPARPFVERHLPDAILSDHPAWVERYSHLDSKRPNPPTAPDEQRRAYGATLGFFENGAANYREKIAACRLARLGERLRENYRKLLRRPAVVRPADFGLPPG